jgi:hypothetical protein
MGGSPPVRIFETVESCRINDLLDYAIGLAVEPAFFYAFRHLAKAQRPRRVSLYLHGVFGRNIARHRPQRMPEFLSQRLESSTEDMPPECGKQARLPRPLWGVSCLSAFGNAFCVREWQRGVDCGHCKRRSTMANNDTIAVMNRLFITQN